MFGLRCPWFRPRVVCGLFHSSCSLFSVFSYLHGGVEIEHSLWRLSNVVIDNTIIHNISFFIHNFWFVFASGGGALVFYLFLGLVLLS